jgi:hypothetical protein
MAKYVSRRRASVSNVKPNRSASVDHLTILTSLEAGPSTIPDGSPTGDRDGVSLNDIVTALDSSDDEDEHEHVNVSVHDKVEETSMRGPGGEATSSRMMTTALPTPPVYTLWSEEKLSSACSSTITKCGFSRNGKFIATSGVDASLVSP